MTRPETKHLPISTAVDLFAGGGGLTVGLKKAGFTVVGAVEVEPHAYSTYVANHPEVKAFRQDIRTISGRSLIEHSPTGTIDLIAGCPPCQGFSSLTSKYKNRSDPRNELVKEMGRLADEVKPSILMMENVPGLYVRGKGRLLFNELKAVLEGLGYIVAHDVLQVADFGVPQSRRRLVLLAGRGFRIDPPQPTHHKTGGLGRKKWLTIKDAIEATGETKTLAEAKTIGGAQAYDWHVVRTLSQRNRERLAAAEPGQAWRTIPRTLRPACHRKETAGFSNVYGRMSWDQVAPTITGGCTTLSKGRFGHPDKARTISVREAALLQTFPKGYLFDTPYMEYACSIIGNALPCKFAEVLARHCRSALQTSDG